ncbi:GNAT family N-acetyltransferase [Shewanella sp. 125m-7]
MNKPIIQVRPFTNDDVSQLAQVFHLSINLGTGSHYNEQQRAVWSPTIRSDEAWLERLAGTLTWVAEIERQVVAFINLKNVRAYNLGSILDDSAEIDSSLEVVDKPGANLASNKAPLTAEVDCLFVHPDFSGTGIASALYQTLEAQALDLDLVQLTVEASYLAKPFFERFGFHTKCQNSHQRGEQVLVNFSMTKDLIK